MTQRVTGHVQLKALRAGGRAKASLNRATRYVAVDPKPWRSTLEQVEAAVTGGGGPNRCGRSEERRVGKECRARWSSNDLKKNECMNVVVCVGSKVEISGVM